MRPRPFTTQERAHTHEFADPAHGHREGLATLGRLGLVEHQPDTRAGNAIDHQPGGQSHRHSCHPACGHPPRGHGSARWLSGRCSHIQSITMRPFPPIFLPVSTSPSSRMASFRGTISATGSSRLPPPAARDTVEDLGPRAADDRLELAIHERAQELAGRRGEIEKYAFLCWSERPTAMGM